MADEKGVVGTPSPAKPIPPNRRRTRMKSLLAQQAAAKAFAKAMQPPAPKRQYTKKAKRWDPKLPAIRVPKLVTVTLQLRHSINGHFYGPGEVKIPEHKARMFLNQEYDAIQKELSLQQQQAFIISHTSGGGMAKRQVPWAQFDTLLGAS